MDFTGYLVPTIVGICLVFGYCFKQIVKSDRAHDFIPTIVCALGALIAIWGNSITGQPITPDVLLTGLASGLASTGAWEMVMHWPAKEGE